MVSKTLRDWVMRSDGTGNHAPRPILAMTQGREAFVTANPGQPVPAPPAMSVIGMSISDRTNTLAILALIFGVLGGHLAIIFGPISLSQINADQTNRGTRGWNGNCGTHPRLFVGSRHRNSGDHGLAIFFR